MDNLRGFDPYGANYDAEPADYARFDDEDDAAIEAPAEIGTDERRMQVRAYNFWTSQHNGNNYPNIEELDPEAVEDFRQYSVLLDFTSGIENPSIPFVGDALRTECGLEDGISYLDEVPARSLLSRITDHYLQIIANRAPIGFEAEFVNDGGLTIMYRGILLPYSSDDDTIDFIYGVINWKEVAGEDLTSSLEREVADALRTTTPRQEHVPVWADGPTTGHLDEIPTVTDELILGEDYVEYEVQPDESSSLSDWLTAARNSAENALDSDTRSRDALYQAIGRAYDFSIVAAQHPQDYAELLNDAGIAVQERAPMTPIVKLVFGAGYDKTRLTEFAAALSYADRIAVQMGGLAGLLSQSEGGLKGVVQAERRARKVASGQHVAPAETDPRPRLRAARTRDLSEFAGAGEEFIVLVARREADGSVAVIGSVNDAAITVKALRKAET